MTLTLFQFLSKHYQPGGDDLSVRVDDRTARDKSPSFCTVVARVCQPDSNDFQLVLTRLPWMSMSQPSPTSCAARGQGHHPRGR